MADTSKTGASVSVCLHNNKPFREVFAAYSGRRAAHTRESSDGGSERNEHDKGDGCDSMRFTEGIVDVDGGLPVRRIEQAWRDGAAQLIADPCHALVPTTSYQPGALTDEVLQDYVGGRPEKAEPRPRERPCLVGVYPGQQCASSKPVP